MKARAIAFYLPQFHPIDGKPVFLVYRFSQLPNPAWARFFYAMWRMTSTGRQIRAVVESNHEACFETARWRASGFH